MLKSLFLGALTSYMDSKGIKWEYTDRVNRQLVKAINKRGEFRFFGAAPLPLWPVNNHMAWGIVKDKELSLRICKEGGLKVPFSQTGTYNAQDYNHLKLTSAHERGENFPYKAFTIKPNDGSQARGLTFLYGKKYLSESIDLAGSISNVILFQELLKGEDIRIYVFDGVPITKLKRTLFTGESHLKEFQLSKKSFLEEGGKTNFLNPYPVSNYALTKIPGTIETEFTDEEKSVAQKIFTSFGLRFFAVDCLKNQSLYILEINGNPGVEALFKQPENPLAAECLANIFELNLNG